MQWNLSSAKTRTACGQRDMIARNDKCSSSSTGNGSSF
jgi:hypothetical protein